MLAQWTERLDGHVFHGRSWGVLGGSKGLSVDGLGNWLNTVATFWEAFYLNKQTRPRNSYLRQAETTFELCILLTIASSGCDCLMGT